MLKQTTPMKRTPMNRGSGFKREKPSSWRPEKRVTKWPVALSVPARAAIQMIADACIVHIKEGVLRSSTYEAAVRRLPCARCGVVNLSQFCHSDEGKGLSLKTDVRRGWPGCGPHDGLPGCHWYVGTSGNMKREERRVFEAQAAASTRAEIKRLGLWPKRLPAWSEEPAALIGRAQAAMKGIAP